MSKVKVFFRSLAGGVEFRKIYLGEKFSDGKKIIVNYTENDENGITDTEIVLIDCDFVTVKRVGDFSNYLEFKEGYSYEGEYLTPYGKIPVTAFTRKLKVNYGETIEINAEYKSSLMGEETENSFTVKIRDYNDQKEATVWE